MLSQHRANCPPGSQDPAIRWLPVAGVRCRQSTPWACPPTSFRSCNQGDGALTDRVTGGLAGRGGAGAIGPLASTPRPWCSSRAATGPTTPGSCRTGELHDHRAESVALGDPVLTRTPAAGKPQRVRPDMRRPRADHARALHDRPALVRARLRELLARCLIQLLRSAPFTRAAWASTSHHYSDGDHLLAADLRRSPRARSPRGELSVSAIFTVMFFCCIGRADDARDRRVLGRRGEARADVALHSPWLHTLASSRSRRPARTPLSAPSW